MPQFAQFFHRHQVLKSSKKRSGLSQSTPAIVMAPIPSFPIFPQFLLRHEILERSKIRDYLALPAAPIIALHRRHHGPADRLATGLFHHRFKKIVRNIDRRFHCSIFGKPDPNANR